MRARELYSHWLGSFWLQTGVAEYPIPFSTNCYHEIAGVCAANSILVELLAADTRSEACGDLPDFFATGNEGDCIIQKQEISSMW